MKRSLRAVVAVAFFCAIYPTLASSQSDLDRIKTKYQAVTAKLEKHIVLDWWIDEDPESPELLARHWALEAEWAAAWLSKQNGKDCTGVKAALFELTQTSISDCIELSKDAFLVAAPDAIGNVFVLAKVGSRYRVAWSTAQRQEASGELGEILSAWRPEHARHGGRGPYLAATGSEGSVTPRLGKLPSDAKGHPRFYIYGIYAQSAGGTVGAQVSVWLWDEKTALPQIGRTFAVMIDHAAATRVEGNLLKVEEKEFFRTFFSCGACEERQTDWTVRLGPEGVEDLGEKSLVPELDAADELFYRAIHHQSAVDVATPVAIKAAKNIVDAAREEHSEKDWKSYPSLGMMGPWNVGKSGTNELLCLSLDETGNSLFTLRPSAGKFFVVDLKQTAESCEK